MWHQTVFHFRILSNHPVTSEEEVLNLLFLGDTNRAIGETAMHLASSRSHCIFILGLDARKAGSDFVTQSKLNVSTKQIYRAGIDVSCDTGVLLFEADQELVDTRKTSSKACIDVSWDTSSST